MKQASRPDRFSLAGLQVPAFGKEAFRMRRLCRPIPFILLAPHLAFRSRFRKMKRRGVPGEGVFFLWEGRL